MVFGRLLRGNSGCSTEASSPKDTPKLAAAAPPKEVDLTASVTELEWELVEPERDQHDVEPLVMDDYLILPTGGGGAGAGAEADLAAGDAAAGHGGEEVTASWLAAEEPATVAEEPKDQREQAEAASRDAPVVAAAGASLAVVPEDEEPSFRCRACRTSIFKPCDVISANYHAQTSPGYLVGVVNNTRMSSEVQTVTYTTGQYSVREVLCQQCSTMLGITYTGTDNAKNQYKVGKYLVGIDRLVLPKGTVHPMDKPGNKL